MNSHPESQPASVSSENSATPSAETSSGRSECSGKARSSAIGDCNQALCAQVRQCQWWQCEYKCRCQCESKLRLATQASRACSGEFRGRANRSAGDDIRPGCAATHACCLQVSSRYNPRHHQGSGKGRCGRCRQRAECDIRDCGSEQIFCPPGHGSGAAVEVCPGAGTGSAHLDRAVRLQAIRNRCRTRIRQALAEMSFCKLSKRPSRNFFDASYSKLSSNAFRSQLTGFPGLSTINELMSVSQLMRCQCCTCCCMGVSTGARGKLT